MCAEIARRRGSRSGGTAWLEGLTKEELKRQCKSLTIIAFMFLDERGGVAIFPDDEVANGLERFERPWRLWTEKSPNGDYLEVRLEDK
jgi:hypothetical protein